MEAGPGHPPTFRPRLQLSDSVVPYDTYLFYSLRRVEVDAVRALFLVVVPIISGSVALDN
jgi:hypothetical protein